jgi:SAM-dependent methyltransferase
VEGAPVRRIYEEHWRDAPDVEPWGFGWRSELLLGEVRPEDRVLDLGCGAGRFLALLDDDAVGVEIAEAAAVRARRQGEVRLIGDDGTLPFGHGEFDLVWCSEVIEHVPDALGLLQEVRRVLKPGGRLLLTTPDHSWWRRVLISAIRFDVHFDPMGHHVRFFTRASLERLLREAGFDAQMERTKVTLVARAVRA